MIKNFNYGYNNQIDKNSKPFIFLRQKYYKDLKQELLREKAISCGDYVFKIIENTNHFYKNKEVEVSKIVKDWIDSRFR